VDEGVVEGGEDVSDTKDEGTLSDLRTQRDGGFFLGDLHFLGGLQLEKNGSQYIAHKKPYPQQKSQSNGSDQQNTEAEGL
jgi:hypothetical protein